MKYIQSNYKQTTWLPLKAIRYAVENNWINSLAYYCLLKKVHQNSLFYDYSLRKVATLIKCSPTTLSHHLKVLEYHGLITIQDKCLIITGTNKLKEIYKSKLIPVKYDANKSNQVSLIRYTLIKRNIAYQKVGYEFRNKAITLLKTGKCKGGKYKAILNYYSGKSLQSLESFNSSKFMLSNKSFGKIVNRSQRTGKTLQAKLNQLGVIKSTKNIVELKMQRLDLRGFNELSMPAKCFLSHRGITFMRLPNSIELKK